jgi:hypothetical protein
MAEGKKPGFWHDIARQVEKEANATPTTAEVLAEWIRRGRPHAQRIRKLANNDRKKNTKS